MTKNVNRGKSCLGEVHEIKGEQHTGKGGGRNVFGQLPGKEIDHRNHCDAKERADDPPAEGIHAEQQYTDGDQYLAEGRMRALVGGKSVNKFIGCARVVDFVEVHTVAEGAHTRIQRCLIKQCGIICCIGWGYRRPVLVQKDKLKQRGRGAFQCQQDLIASAVQSYCLPGKDILQSDRLKMVQEKVSVVSGGDEIGKAADLLTVRQIERQGNLVAGSHFIRGGGCAAVSEIIQSKGTVDQSDDDHTDHVGASGLFFGGLRGLRRQGYILRGRKAVLFQPCSGYSPSSEGQSPQPENAAVQKK